MKYESLMDKRAMSSH